MKATTVVALCLALADLGFTHPTVPQADSDRDHHRRNRVKSAAPKAVTEDAAFWNQVGQDTLTKHLENQPINRQAKNIIFFLGDGMSIPTITAARIYKGQKVFGKPGEETVLEFETFPYTGLSKTYCVDYQVADSACSATAYLTGVKTNIDTIGVDANVNFANCTAQNIEEYHTQSIMKWAQEAGKGTGIVTTTRVTHATPAGTYAHVANRDWEADIDITYDGEDPVECDDIAEQLILGQTGSNFKVILGGGRRKFLPRETADPEGGSGSRTDGVDLTEVWKASKADLGASYQYVTSQEELLAVDPDNTDYLLGLFSSSHLEYYLQSEGAQNPTLEEMTVKAIQRLSREENGFVLLVEGGKIDLAHHDGTAQISLAEVTEFEKAIYAARRLTTIEDTLIIVTADHAHTMTINGYPLRGNPIFGIGDISDTDLRPWTTLSYANGPGYRRPDADGNRYDITNDDLEAVTYRQIATAPVGSETHGGDDVAVFAIGPQAHLLQGVFEQNYIAHVMRYAACIGPGLHFCTKSDN